MPNKTEHQNHHFFIITTTKVLIIPASFSPTSTHTHFDTTMVFDVSHVYLSKFNYTPPTIRINTECFI